MWTKVTDETILEVLGRSGGLSKELALDMAETVEGALWAHVEDMARRGIIVIEGEVAKLKP